MIGKRHAAHGADVQAEDQACPRRGSTITSCGPDRPSRTPRRVRRENLTGVERRSSALSTWAHGRSLPLRRARPGVESATGGGTASTARRTRCAVGLAGRLRGDEAAEPRPGRCGLLRDDHAGGDRAACCRCATRARRRPPRHRPPRCRADASASRCAAAVAGEPPAPYRHRRRTAAAVARGPWRGSLPVRRESGIGIGRLSAALASCSADIAWYMSKPMKRSPCRSGTARTRP